jgi:hypothetical protein
MHNPLDETHRASCLRENLTSSSYGEGLETDRTTSQVPRQSLTRQLKYDGFRSLAVIQNGRTQRGEPCFFAFDLLMSDGKDLRTEKLTDRKQELRRLMSKIPESRMRYADHVQHHGTALFQRVCKMDLEGIVSKHSLASYTTERTTWFKIKNPKYSQMEGREELFERERHKEPVAGWHCCELACAEMELNA